jgi:hypothetical protein
MTPQICSREPITIPIPYIIYIYKTTLPIPISTYKYLDIDIGICIAGQKIVKVLKREQSINGLLTLYLGSNPLICNRQQIVGLCKLLTVNAINF